MMNLPATSSHPLPMPLLCHLRSILSKLALVFPLERSAQCPFMLNRLRKHRPCRDTMATVGPIAVS